MERWVGMSAVAVLGHDSDVTTGDDPHGLRARMAVLGLRNKDVAEILGVAPNSVTRAIGTTEPSDTRPRIEDLIVRREQEREAPGAPAGLPAAARKLAQLAGDDRLVDVRIEYIGDGKVQRLVALLVDSALSAEEVEREVREWRKGHE